MMPWPAGTLRRYAAARAMKTSITWSPGAGLNVVRRRTARAGVDGHGGQPAADFCPGCGAQSKSRHSTYWRTLRDLSAQGAPVIVNARLGRWRCRNQLCDRRIFTERVPGLAAPFARRTARLAGIVRLLGHSAGGRPSERLMRRLGMPVSDTTILAGLRKHARARSESNAGPPSMWLALMTGRGGRAPTTARSSLTWSVVGWWTCWRIVRRRPRPVGSRIIRTWRWSAATVLASMRRLRVQGAPQARQVADRFHLLQNFRETVERQLGRYEAPIPDSRVNPRDGQATLPLPAQLGLCF